MDTQSTVKRGQDMTAADYRALVDSAPDGLYAYVQLRRAGLSREIASYVLRVFQDADFPVRANAPSTDRIQ